MIAHLPGLGLGTLLIRTSLELIRAHVPLLHMCAYLLLIAPVRKVKCHSTQRERRLTFLRTVNDEVVHIHHPKSL